MAYKRKDYYYNKAKAEKKASRAAYKISQLHKKYKLVDRGDTVVDLGAAPGGWMQELGRMVGKKGFVLGVDKLPVHIFPKDNMLFFLGDIQSEDMIEQLRLRLLTENVDTIVSDLAPNISGISFSDSYKSFELAQRAFDICNELLKEGGNFVVKIFPGKEQKQFQKLLVKHFKKVHAVVPPATRSTSSEMYLVARDFQPKF